ncbi:MAG: ribosome maturation factor RimP [Candidatus Omnitrophota bacterium]|nr:ribosome maturation factor RimP [Candidatus Omnitrophota bacterium]
MGLVLINPFFFVKFMEIVDRVREIAEVYLRDHGIELIDIVFRREGPGLVLRITADTPEGITVSECTGLNKFLSEVLDREDVIQDRYTLEVSSPGLDRPIKTDRDFERSMGKELELTTFEAIDGRKTYEGVLVGMDKENVVIERQGISTVIPRSKIALARLKIDF